MPDAAVGQHHFQPENLGPHIAVGKHLHAAGIGGDGPAYLRRSIGSEAHGKQPIRICRRLLHDCDRHTGFGNDTICCNINTSYLIHATEAEDKLALARHRHPARHQPRITALRHDGDAVFGA